VGITAGSREVQGRKGLYQETRTRTTSIPRTIIIIIIICICADPAALGPVTGTAQTKYKMYQ
jgi:hypothetical protein